MLNRTHSNAYENTHFPLACPDSVFPDNLISWVSLLVPDNVARVALYTIRSDKGDLSISIGIYTSEGLKPYAYYTGKIPEHRVCNLLAEDSNTIIGYMYMGSGVYDDCNLVGPVDIDASCYVYDPASRESIINGKTAITPDVLNIAFSGCVGVENKGVYELIFVPTINPSTLDGRDRLTYGCISTINSTVIADHTLTIHLPKGCTATCTVNNYDNTITDPYRGTPIDHVVITIKDGLPGSADYGCTISDPIMDIFHPVSYDNTLDNYEKPLDRYINAYVDWFKSTYMGSTGERVQDTTVVDSYDVFTYDNQEQFSEAPRIYSADNISISDGYNVSVLVKNVDDNGSISWE